MQDIIGLRDAEPHLKSKVDELPRKHRGCGGAVACCIIGPSSHLQRSESMSASALCNAPLQRTPWPIGSSQGWQGMRGCEGCPQGWLRV